MESGFQDAVITMGLEGIILTIAASPVLTILGLSSSFLPVRLTAHKRQQGNPYQLHMHKDKLESLSIGRCT
jgi:hypothetical protein